MAAEADAAAHRERAQQHFHALRHAAKSCGRLLCVCGCGKEDSPPPEYQSCRVGDEFSQFGVLAVRKRERDRASLLQPKTH